MIARKVGRTDGQQEHRKRLVFWPIAEVEGDQVVQNRAVKVLVSKLEGSVA